MAESTSTSQGDGRWPGGRASARAAVGVFLAAFLMITLALPGLLPSRPAAAAASGRSTPSPGQGSDRAEEFAIAFGHLLDTPVPFEVIDEGLEIADQLRQRYGIQTGNLHNDRLEAARRAEQEIVDPLSFSPEQLESAARSLGYSLDPNDCGNYCENVRRLAILELKMRALRAFAQGAGVEAAVRQR
ncbi:MAG: hypothetical protein V3U86_10085 [Acidobacteriota bacterium]